MGPGFHLFYARRLAWRYRFLLAIPLALLGLLHPFFALASLLPFLLPARLWEGRALREIARASLAYPTALAYGEERLWQEARKVEIPPPPFPLGLFALYLVLLALALGSWTGFPPKEARPFGSLPGAERPATPQGSPDRGKPAEAPRSSPEKTTQSPDFPGSTQGTESGQGHPAPQEGKAPGPSPQEPSPTPPEASPQAPGEEGIQAPTDGQGGLRARPGLSQPEPANAEGTGIPTPGAMGPPPKVEAPASLSLPEPAGPGQELLEPGREGKGQGLPSPWRAGGPPEEVRRGVEVYLERTPLSPEAKELLRRYFSGP